MKSKFQEKIKHKTNVDWNWWMSCLTTKGKFDEKKIKNELHDLIFVAEQVSEVYCYITGNTLSKPFYYAESIKEVYDEQIEDSYNEGYSSAKEELKETNL